MYKEKHEIYSIKISHFASIIFISFFITAIFGIGEFNRQTLDFSNNNFKYFDLATYTWPVYYKDFNSYLCYYNGYYLPISFLCKITNLEYGRYYSLIWNWIGLVLALLWVMVLCPKRSGLVIILILLYNDSWFFIQVLRTIGISSHLPANYVDLNGYYLVFMAPFSDQMAWAPQHVLPGIICAWYFLFVHNNFSKWHYIELITIWISSIFWSPFATVGLVPFIIYISIKYRNELLQDMKIVLYLIPVLLSFCPVILYLISTQAVSNSSTNMFIWQAGVSEWPIYYLIYIVPNFIIWIPFLKENTLSRNIPILWIAIITLCVLPFYRIGIYNDFQMRANVPSLCIVGLLISQQLSNVKLGCNWISKFATIFFIVNSISVFKLYSSFFPISKPVNSIERPFLNDSRNTLEFLTKTYGGPQAARQYLMKEDSFFQKNILKK